MPRVGAFAVSIQKNSSNISLDKNEMVLDWLIESTQFSRQSLTHTRLTTLLWRAEYPVDNVRVHMYLLIQHLATQRIESNEAVLLNSSTTGLDTNLHYLFSYLLLVQQMILFRDRRSGPAVVEL